MTPPLFLAERVPTEAGSRFLLDGPEGRHAAAVRRIAVGERLDVADGAGTLAECVVAEVGRDRLTLDVLGGQVVPAPQPRLVVVQALAKGERAETAVEQMTEVGVDEIVPWQAARSVVSWRGDRAGRGPERWQRAAREAAKQARRPYVPTVARLATTEIVIERLARAVLGVVLHEQAWRSLTEVALPDSGEIVVVVGPEGGLTEEEIGRFGEAGASGYRMGPTVLRSATAAVVASAALLSRSMRWLSGP